MHDNFLKFAAKQSDSEDTPRWRKQLAGAGTALGARSVARLTGGLAAGIPMGMAMNRLVRDAEDQKLGKDLQEAILSRRHLRQGKNPLILDTQGKMKGNAFYLQPNLGHMIRNPGKSLGVRQATWDKYNKGGHSGLISGDPRLVGSGTILAHEFGHATGTKIPALALGLSDTAAGGVGVIGGAYAGARAHTARTREEIADARKLNRRVLGAQLLLGSPRLMEEARASIRAQGLAKKLTGRGVNKAALGTAFGTYLVGAGAGGLGTYAVNERRLRQAERALGAEKQAPSRG